MWLSPKAGERFASHCVQRSYTAIGMEPMIAIHYRRFRLFIARAASLSTFGG